MLIYLYLSPSLKLSQNTFTRDYEYQEKIRKLNDSANKQLWFWSNQIIFYYILYKIKAKIIDIDSTFD